MERSARRRVRTGNENSPRSEAWDVRGEYQSDRGRRELKSSEYCGEKGSEEKGTKEYCSRKHPTRDRKDVEEHTKTSFLKGRGTQKSGEKVSQVEKTRRRSEEEATGFLEASTANLLVKTSPCRISRKHNAMKRAAETKGAGKD